LTISYFHNKTFYFPESEYLTTISPQQIIQINHKLYF
jgi:hypothetical protein